MRWQIQHGIPLVIDNAYGVPFPGIIFSEARPPWNPNIVLYEPSPSSACRAAAADHRRQ